ncbi:hypothetical protein [Pseudomonas sp.]|uniref:hypothetical protein n=1 Tax=Pseudomonas sp. TaxID=306 RepID=UPI0028A8907C|nr:hypothetical protein [Pseudomonas sp.]
MRDRPAFVHAVVGTLKATLVGTARQLEGRHLIVDAPPIAYRWQLQASEMGDEASAYALVEPGELLRRLRSAFAQPPGWQAEALLQVAYLTSLLIHCAGCMSKSRRLWSGCMTSMSAQRCVSNHQLGEGQRPKPDWPWSVDAATPNSM